MLTLGVDLGHNVGVELGQFLLHLLDLEFLAIEAVGDVVGHRDDTHPEHSPEDTATCVLYDDCALFF